VSAVEPGLVKSAVRVLDIFEFFATRRRPATIQEVATELGYPHSSATTLLNSLRDRGYLGYDANSRTYMPTLKLVMLSQWMVEESSATGSLLALLGRLQAATNETAILGVREGAFVRYLQVLSSGEPIRMFIPAGSLRPLHRTASGIMLMSAIPSSERAQVLDESLAIESASVRGKLREQAKDAIDEGARQKWYVSRGQMTPGAGVVAALLPPIQGMPVMTLAVGAPLDRLDANLPQILRALSEATGSDLPSPQSRKQEARK
jgi:DNA-binding IclR family transcriptional regulator